MIIVQTEASLNFRPRYPTSSTLGDFDALAQAYFLIKRPITNLVELDLSHVSEN